MRKLPLLPALCLIFIFLCSSCVSKKKWTELMSDKEQLDNMLSQTQDQVKSLENDIADLGDEKDKLQKEFEAESSRLNDQISGIQGDLEAAKKESEEMKELVASKDQEISKMADAMKSPFIPFTSKGLELMENYGNLYVKNPVRFKSGSARLTDDSKMALQNIVSALIADPKAKMVVEGHTDNVPMKEGATWASNKELSVARALAVVKVMVDMGANPDQLKAVGHGAKRPAMGYEDVEDVNEARELNRRAEFSVVTNQTALFQLSQAL